MAISSRRAWIFDLDDTLHDASARVFPHINLAMTHYLQTELNLSEKDACRLRQFYWERYGATLLGLMRHHGTDPGHFLHHTHQFPDLGAMVLRPNGLRQALDRLPGRKYVYTNAPMSYALRVLDILKIRTCMEGVFSIESGHYSPKPTVTGFRRMLRTFRLRARDCVMVEDSLPALRTAKRLGMATVHITRNTGRAPYVDASLRSVLALSRTIANTQ